MPSLDDLKKRIKSVKSTQKITKAMKMVAAAKLRRAQENAEKGRPFSEKMNNIILNLSNSIIEKDNGNIISKPSNREEALVILKKLNGQKHYLISSVCISKNGSMIWNYTDKAVLTMKQMTNNELKSYLTKIKDATLYSYNVYQIEGEGRSLFSKIEGDENTIMGLPIKQIKEYLKQYE